MSSYSHSNALMIDRKQFTYREDRSSVDWDNGERYLWKENLFLVVSCTAKPKHTCETRYNIRQMRTIHLASENYSKMYYHYGFLREKTILARYIYILEKDSELLAKRKAGVAHNRNSDNCPKVKFCGLLFYEFQASLRNI